MIQRSAIRQAFESRVQRACAPLSRCAVLHSWREVADHLPAPGENTVLVTRRQFSAFEFVPILLFGPCERLMITTYNISQSAVGMLDRLLETGEVMTCDVLVSESMRRLSDGGAAVDALAALEKTFRGRFRARALDIHAKVICMAMASGDAWVVEGSGNMARNTSIELYSLFNDPARLAFHAGWIGGLV